MSRMLEKIGSELVEPELVFLRQEEKPGATLVVKRIIPKKRAFWSSGTLINDAFEILEFELTNKELGNIAKDAIDMLEVK